MTKRIDILLDKLCHRGWRRGQHPV